MQIINEDINRNKDIIALKSRLKEQNILLSIGIVEDLDTGCEGITLVILDNNKIINKSTVLPIPAMILNYNFNDLINYIVDHFT